MCPYLHLLELKRTLLHPMVLVPMIHDERILLAFTLWLLVIHILFIIIVLELHIFSGAELINVI